MTVEQIALQIATTQVGQAGSVPVKPTTVEYRRHDPDRYEVRDRYEDGMMKNVLVDHVPGEGWEVHTRNHWGGASHTSRRYPTAQDAIVQALGLVVLPYELGLRTPWEVWV